MKPEHLEYSASYDERAEEYQAKAIAAEQAGHAMLATELRWWEYRMRLAARRARIIAAEADTDIPMAIARREYCAQRDACDEPPAHLATLWADLPYEHRDHLRAFVMAGIAHVNGGSDV